VNLARWVSYRSGIVVADSALRQGVTRAELEAVVADCARWPGIRRARQVVGFANGLAASPLESVSRLAFAEAGLPPPRLQVPIGDPAWPDGIVDFLWEEYGVIGEADGLLKYDGRPLSLRAEKLRQEALEARGYIVVRWTWDDIWRRPEWVIARLRQAMAEGARRRTA
jgi:very-short-patch-repair endonuclease